MPASVIAKTEEAEDTGLTVRLPDGAVELDEAALESIASGKTVTVSVQQAKLTDAQQEAVSALAQVAVVVDVDIVVGKVKQSAFGGGRLTISIPYTPEKGEDMSTLAVWHIRDDGSIENKGGSYDAKSGCFVFETDHLSHYLLVHTEQVMGFTDVPANSWYAGAVAWAVEQGITSGTSDTTFSPNISCTRAQMVQMLKNASDAAQYPDYRRGGPARPAGLIIGLGTAGGFRRKISENCLPLTRRKNTGFVGQGIHPQR
nr:S-layer homology domain-containing protein [Intestinimonas sp. MSJ-38]